MKKTILIIVTAAICSLSYAQDIYIPYFLNDFHFDFNDPQSDLIKKNPNAKVSSRTEEELIFEVTFDNFKINETKIPLTFYFNNDSIYFVTFTIPVNSLELYYTTYAKLKIHLGEFDHLYTKQKEEATIFPDDEHAYSLLKKNEYEFSQYFTTSKGSVIISTKYLTGIPCISLVMDNNIYEYQDKVITDIIE